MQEKSIYDFKVKDLSGNVIDFSTFKGKNILIVNTASECGFTPQYADLEELYKKERNRLVVVGFPTDDFGGQEPGTNEEIGNFCKKNYGVTFPIAEKITVKGPAKAPIYDWLTSREKNGVADAEISWNFNKFLIDENGKLLKKFESKISPTSDEILNLL